MKTRNKERETSSAAQLSADPRMIFIRNLPYNLTDPELQEVFSEIGPVRRSFIVKEKGKEQHRGFGFVQFAAAEHATCAVKVKDGTDLQGRKIMVTLANRRPSFELRRTKKHPEHENSNGDQLANDAKTHEEESPQKLLTIEISKDKKHGDHIDPKEETPHEEPAILNKKKKQFADTKSISAAVSDVQRKDKHKRNESGMTEGPLEKKNGVICEEKSSAKQRVARTIIFGGLITPEMREAVIERAKKIGSVESVQSSLSHQELKGRGLERDGCKMGAASVVYTSVKAACQAVVALHGKSIGGGVVWARQQGGEGSKTKKWRVIIRNLPFSITEDKIRELFTSIGFVWEVTIPRKPDGQAKGFAFASFMNKDNAEKAITMINGKILEKRTIAIDWAVERNVYEMNANVDKKSEDNAEKFPSDIEDEDTASESEIEERGGEDVESSIVDELDMAKKVLKNVVSAREREENELNAMEEDEETASESEEDDETASESEEEDNSEGNAGNVEPTVAEEFDLATKVPKKFISTGESGKTELNSTKYNASALKGAQSQIIEESESQIQEKHMDGQKDTEKGDLNKTIFIKNLPFDVNSGDIKKHFLSFGKVKSVHLVLHPKTKRPKGSAFLEFLSEHDAEAALAAAKGEGKFVNGIVFGGRKLEVLKAMEKNTAKAIAKERLETPNVDRRNLYLAEEGKIEGTPAAHGVSDEDMQKRRQLEQVKATKLRSPNFHVSRTRLAVYNVPKSMTEPELRQLLIDAVKSRATKQNPFVKQVSILKDKAKGNKSRGVAFVEFSEHEHALVALRVLNNNPDTFGPERRPIVQFTIEDLQKLKKYQLQKMENANRKVKCEGEVIDSQTSVRKAKPRNVNKKSDSEKKIEKQSKQDDSNSEKQSKQDHSKLFESKKRKRNSKLKNDQALDSVKKDVQMSRKSDSGKRFEKKMKQDDSKSFATNKRKGNPKFKNDIDSDKDGQMSKIPVSKRQKIKDVQMEKVSVSKKQKAPVSNLENKSTISANWRPIQQEGKQRNGVNNQKTNESYSSNQSKANKKKKNSKVEIQDKLDHLVAKYRNQYFSDGSSAKKSVNGNTSSDLKRWFD